MNTLAAEIISQIKKHLEFKNDLSFLFAHSFLQNHKRTSFATKQSKIGDENIVIYKRLIESAYLFSQSESDEDKNLAQSIAYHLNVVTGDDYLKQMSENLLRVLGNFPGATYLQQENGFIPESFYAFLKRSFIENENKIKISNKEITLTNFQKRVWESLHSNVPQAISAPTSAGKSFLVVEMLANGIISGELNSAIYIAPTRALVNEITQKFIIKTLPYQNEVRVTSIPTINNEYNKQIFVLTQERLQVLLDNFEEKIDLVVIDEAQSISDEIRGMILQDCLDKISTQNPNAKYVFLAPGAEGFDDLADIIGIDAIHIEKTNLSPVVQNKIIVKVDPSKENNLQLSLLDNSDILPIGEIESTRGFANENTRLAAVALELGKNEGSLVYGTGAENAEDVAKQISSGLHLLEDDSELQELSKFIKKHVHEDYSLANLVLRGVGYHYGKMPSLLRETLEKNFTNNKLKFLVCTTTLFQGVNLPAKNVFIDTPTRGNRGEKLDPASLWNFAGRAGRLGYAFSGNVYLIDYDDLMKFTDVVLEKYPIKADRVGVTGGSYGGYMTNWIIGHTDRFRCAASQRSIANWISKFGTTDIGYYFNADQNASTPWINQEKLWWHSPMKYADKVKTPTLFIHSEEDYRCWLAEGIQMFTALKYHGVEARLCMFRGENHELSRSGKPKHRVRRLEEMTNWFEKYLKD